MNDPNTLLQNRLRILEAEGEAAIGQEAFQYGLRLMTQAGGAQNISMHAVPRGQTVTNMQEIIGRPDASERIVALSRDALLAAETNGDQTAKRINSELRTREREAYRTMKGRR